MANGVAYITIQQFCAFHQCETVIIEEFIDHGIIEAREHGGIWTIQEPDVLRVERALRLREELGVNAAGIDIILTLLERLEGQRFGAVEDL